MFRRFLNYLKSLFSKPKKTVSKPIPTVPDKKPVVSKPAQENKPSKFEFKKGMIGVDISHHVRNVDLALLSKNVDFIYMKATEGATFVSNTYVDRANELDKLGTPWGAYHYYRVNVNPITQANHFLTYINVDSGLPPVLDIEAINNNFKTHHRNDLLVFLRAIEAQTGITPIIYTGFYFARDEIKPTQEFAKYPLWLSWYTKDFRRVKTPKPWDKITIWQHTESGNITGVSGQVDMNKVV